MTRAQQIQWNRKHQIPLFNEMYILRLHSCLNHEIYSIIYIKSSLLLYNSNSLLLSRINVHVSFKIIKTKLQLHTIQFPILLNGVIPAQKLYCIGSLLNIFALLDPISKVFYLHHCFVERHVYHHTSQLIPLSLPYVLHYSMH